MPLVSALKWWKRFG